MNDLFNYLGNGLNETLYNLDRSLHQKIKGSAIDSFIHELRDYLFKSDAVYRLSKLPKDTLLEVNEIEESYIACFYNHERYDIPKEMIDLSELNDLNMYYDRLQLQNDGLYHVIKKESI